MTSGTLKFMTRSMRACLSDEELYDYLTGTRGLRSAADLESHLAMCPTCRQELAGLIEVLHPENGDRSEQVPEMSPAETARILKAVRESGHVAQPYVMAQWTWRRWLSLAAAVILMAGLGSLALTWLVQHQQSSAFYEQGKSALQRIYVTQSHSGLRLDLPFRSMPMQRGSENDKESLQRAEQSFYQALAVRDGFPEARLGLAYVHLQREDFPRASEEFRRILQENDANDQARLGLGVSEYETGMAARDPLKRNEHLEIALACFGRILQTKPGHAEASYNRVLALFELGRHNEALKEIGRYLEQDSQSPWADRLKNLQYRLQLNRSDLVEKEISAAAERHDELTLDMLARSIPYRMPAAIRATYRNALTLEGTTPEAGKPDAASLEWAVGILEHSHAAATGDNGSNRLSSFYRSLSPEQRETKRILDAKFQDLVEVHKAGDVVAPLRGAKSLISGYEQLQDHWQLANLRQLRGNCYLSNDMDLESAMPEYLGMLQHAKAAGAADLTAMALGCLATASVEGQRYEQGIEYLQQMKAIAADAQLLPWLTFAFNTLGNIYTRLNHFQEALDEYALALPLAQQLMDEEVVGAAFRGLATVLEKMGRIPEARRLVQEALRSLDNFSIEGSRRPAYSIKVDRLNLIHREGILALKVKDLDTAESCFQKNLIVLAREKMPELEARSHLGSAHVYLLRNDLPRAMHEANASLSKGSRQAFPEVDWEALQILGVIASRNGNNQAAIDYLQRSIATLEKYRHGIASLDLRHAFFSHRYNPYQEIVSQLHQSGNDIEALGYLENAKSMTLRESLARIQYPEDPGQVNKPWPEFGASAVSFPGNMVIFDYFLTSREILLFASTRHGLQVHSLKIDPAQLDTLVGEFLASMKQQDAALEGQSRRLFSILVEPALDALTDSAPATLVIIPDGALHRLPFAALMDHQGRYLIERLPLSYAPSRSILRYCLQRRPGRTADNLSMLLLDGTSNLQGASTEITYLKQLFGPRVTLIDGRDLARLPLSAAQADIIHFAGHARLRNGRPNLAFSLGSRELLLDPWSIRDLRLRSTSLVTLAGCSTGVGPEGEGETPWGLIPAFFTAGASTLMVSLLPLDDAAAGALSAHFYELLSRGAVTKAAALQQAQISLIRGNNPSPASAWAPIVLVGNPL